MKIKIRKDTVDAVGEAKLAPFGLSSLGWRQGDAQEVDLALLDPKRLKTLAKLLEPHVALLGVKRALYDIALWEKARTNPDVRARDAKQMSALLKVFLAKVPGHRVFRRVRDAWYCYYVDSIRFVPKYYSHDHVIPEHMFLNLRFEAFGRREKENLRFELAAIRNRTPAMLLAEHELHPETTELRDEYLEHRDRYLGLLARVGTQLRVWGSGSDDLDGNPGRDDDEDRYWWRRSATMVPLGTPDDPTRAVVDVYKETKKEDDDDDKEATVDLEFWDRKTVYVGDDDDNDDQPTPEAREEAAIEVPIHTVLPVFHLPTQLRMRVHVSNCEKYTYDRKLADKLVLAPELKSLVSLLIEHQAGGFQDVVAGKAGGAVVMLAGPPGTGKTLTAEVYAESEERALYSVQCSQLGTNAADLEAALMKCFARCARWNAVMLLDEADVYVRRRGDSIAQNAIVGVFLRVLEYQSAVLFLTTNRPEDVDDAVASRCIARLVYARPSPEGQARIWRILADQSKLKLPDAEIRAIVKADHSRTGRDVKNLLKLAALMARGKPITAATVAYCAQFKPTTE